MKCPKCESENITNGLAKVIKKNGFTHQCKECYLLFQGNETTADEDFEKLGLIKNNCNRGNFEYSYQTENGRWQSIMFQVEKKQYHATLQITMEEHKAIHKKLKELRWIN